ncbi:hypothetical protein MKY09_07480 [Psychrobacillus sp. FSL K6-4046]|uniref:hypothetical protein n=1 Tax=unclassified Psychrobacillus TaxID=2636677 RepID=UPI00203C60AC|nr:hypothetical protein [Psychrobacillus sp. MER TA 171]MCM3357820.1 hypothetical protein [Psychrobacillus sp. MER TA 171]
MVPNINLLPQMERRKSNSILVLVIGIILIVTVLLWFFIQYMSLKGDIELLENEEIYSIEEKTDLADYMSNVDLSSEGDFPSSVAFAETISYPVSPLLIEVDTLIEEHTYLRQYGFLEQGMTLVVDIETLSSLSYLVTNLLNSEYFTDAKIESIANFNPSNDTENNEVHFNIIPRYSATLTLEIDTGYLRNGGGTP